MLNTDASNVIDKGFSSLLLEYFAKVVRIQTNLLGNLLKRQLTLIVSIHIADCCINDRVGVLLSFLSYERDCLLNIGILLGLVLQQRLRAVVLNVLEAAARLMSCSGSGSKNGLIIGTPGTLYMFMARSDADHDLLLRRTALKAVNEFTAPSLCFIL